jgi:hypothetical protein
MAKHPPYSVVVTFTEDPRRLTMQAVDAAKLAPIVADKMAVPFFWGDDDECTIDDEMARQLGVAMLNVIALGRPEIKRLLSLTQHPIDKSSG